MKQLIVPTDFSENALTAAKFAHALSSRIQADLLIVHAYTPFRSGFQAGKTNLSDSERAREEAEKEMELFKQKLISGPSDRTIHFEIKEGSLISVIQALTKDCENKFIVMGTTGASGMQKLIGSNTLYIAKNTTLPLLAVPPHAVPSDIRKVGFFTDFKSHDKENMKHLVRFLGKDTVSYHVIHILEKNEKEERILTKLKDWTSELQQVTGLDTLPFSLKNSAGTNVMIKQIIERNGFDVLGLTLEQKSFWDSLFEKNLAKDIILQITIPVFIMH